MTSSNERHFVPTQYQVSDFLDWQRNGTLDLKPRFQRRSVWKSGARSFLVDTVLRGLPVPLVFLRRRLDLVTGRTVREVVDGQQRLRTLISYIDPTALDDYLPERDHFSISRTHNLEAAGKRFEELSDQARQKILSYGFSVQVLPDGLSDAEILEIFARLNSTGQSLNRQELRNAAFFGELKTLVYRLAFEQTERWLRFSLYNSDKLSRMQEVELTSDLVNNMLYGLSGKNQSRLDRLYRDFDESFPDRDVVEERFRLVMSVIDEQLGRDVASTVYRAEMHFFTLFMYTYDRMYGLDLPLSSVAPRQLPRNYRSALLEVSRRFKEWEVPPDVLDAVTHAATDLSRRRIRLEFMASVASGETWPDTGERAAKRRQPAPAL